MRGFSIPFLRWFEQKIGKKGDGDKKFGRGSSLLQPCPRLNDSTNKIVKRANEEIENAQKSKEKEVFVAQATIKKLKMKNGMLGEQLKEKLRDTKELTAICEAITKE